MKMQKQTTKKIIISLVMILVLAPVLNLIFFSVSTIAISKACKNSAACMEAVAKEEEANKNAAVAASSANAYQMKVAELSTEIAGKEAEIAETQARVSDLKKQIKDTEAKLVEEQEALAELLINMHFESDAEPIRILAGSTSISDLAEKAAREEVVKSQISATATAVRKVKEKLEADKEEVETLLAQLQTARSALVSKRSEQQALVDKYANDAEAYAEVAKAAQEAQREAEKKEQEAHPERYAGSVYTGINTYPWQGDCPARQDAYGTTVNGRYIGGYVCECVSYVGWKAYEEYDLYLAWGNAYNWDDRARSAGYKVDHNPEAGSIGQIDSGAYGHVFWVESVEANGSINVTEYNNSSATYLYSGIYRMGDFGARNISASMARSFNYIHLK